MIEKLRKIQDTWLIKLILILTALSFMSLFGVTGYISSAANNNPVITVDDVTVSKDEILFQYNKAEQLMKSFLGEDYEINDATRSEMVLEIVQKELLDAIVKNFADQENMYIGNDMIKQLIQSNPEFLDHNNKFDVQKFKRILSAMQLTEQQYIANLKTDIIKNILINAPVSNMNLPETMLNAALKVDNQEKVFKYIKIVPQNIKINRSISDEELQMYYEDFKPNFMLPETRDISYMILSVDQMAKQITPSDVEIEEYYNENKEKFQKPEQREVLQMVFDKQEDAQTAKKELSLKKNFFEVAKAIAGQSEEDTKLGWVSKDMLIADVADAVFEAQKNVVVGPIKSQMGWHIMKVAKIQPGKTTSLENAKKSIIDEIQKDTAYDNAYEASKNIEDKLAAGTSLEDVAKEYGAEVNVAKQVNENAEAKSMPQKHKKIIANQDFLNTVFGYNKGETSQVVELEDGFAVIRVDEIYETKAKDIALVKPQIEKMWVEAEKNAIAQENVNDIMHDLETGDDINSVAQRFGFEVKTTRPLKRNDSFENLNKQNMLSLFKEAKGTPKLLETSNAKIIAVADRVINKSLPATSKLAEATQQKITQQLNNFVANRLVEQYGHDFEVKVEYKELGLAD